MEVIGNGRRRRAEAKGTRGSLSHSVSTQQKLAAERLESKAGIASPPEPENQMSQSWIPERLEELKKGARIRVIVQGAKRSRQNIRRHTKYAMSINCGVLDWTQEYCYKMFQRLRCKIEQEEKRKLGVLPKRRWIIFDSGPAMQNRLGKLQELFDNLVAPITYENRNDNITILEFLGFRGTGNVEECASMYGSGTQSIFISNGIEGEYTPEVSPWAYALKALLPSHTKQIPVGLLYIKVISAKNLPDMDQFGGADPYVKLSLGTENPIEAKTTTIKNERNPYWGEKFIFEVVNATSVLKVNVFDEDIGDDDPIGHVEIPLSGVKDRPVVKSYNLRRPPGVQFHRNASPTRTFPGQDTKSAQKGAERHLKMLCLEENYARLHPAVTLQLQFRSTTIAKVASAWNPEPVPESEPLEYSINRVYAQAMILLDNLWPIIAFFMGIGSVIAWEDPLWSSWIFVCFIACCLRPSLIAVLCQCWLVYYIVMKYAQHIAKINSRLPERVADIKIVSAARKEEINLEKKYDLGWKLEHITNTVTKLGNLDETLFWYQVQLTYVNSILDMIFKLFDWTNSNTTFTILMALLVSIAYCLLFPVHYVVMLGGGYVLLMQTTPIIFILWFLNGSFLLLAAGLQTIQARIAKTKKETPDQRRFSIVSNSESPVQPRTPRFEIKRQEEFKNDLVTAPKRAARGLDKLASASEGSECEGKALVRGRHS